VGYGSVRPAIDLRKGDLLFRRRSATGAPSCLALGLAAVAAALLAGAAEAQNPADAPLPTHLEDRGSGLPTSKFGTYVRRGEWLAGPAFEYVKNQDFEYDPAGFGFPAPEEGFHGRYQASEARVFLAYGLSDRLAVELETGAIRASLHKAADDPSGLPAENDESGLGQVRARLTSRLLEERGRRPELFGYVEALVPHEKTKPLVGTPDWVFNGGLGLIRGFRWGTVTLRAGLQYDLSSATPSDFHEYAVEYLKRLSPRWSVFLGYVVLEGDEAYLAGELQWSPSPNVIVKVGNRKGVVSSALSSTSNSADWAPAIAVLFRFPKR
jgi:hypothetical protein